MSVNGVNQSKHKGAGAGGVSVNGVKQSKHKGAGGWGWGVGGRWAANDGNGVEK